MGVAPDTITGVLAAMSIRSLGDMEALLGADSEAMTDLRRLFELAAGYGYQVCARGWERGCEGGVWCIGVVWRVVAWCGVSWRLRIGLGVE